MKVCPAGSAVPHLSGEAGKLAFPKLWNSLEVTFLFEQFLLELRHVAFEGKSHLREKLWVDSCPGSFCATHACMLSSFLVEVTDPPAPGFNHDILMTTQAMHGIDLGEV